LVTETASTQAKINWYWPKRNLPTVAGNMEVATVEINTYKTVFLIDTEGMSIVDFKAGSCEGIWESHVTVLLKAILSLVLLQDATNSLVLKLNSF
jgi:hypothetical protein